MSSPSLVEAAYRRAVDSMTVAEKFERMVTLTAWTRCSIERQILTQCGPLRADILKLRVALWIYSGEPETRRLIEEALARAAT